MSKTISTLVPDIYQVLRNSLDGKGIKLTIEQQAELGARIAAKVRVALDKQAWARPPKTLRMSEIGKPCIRQLWYSVHSPGAGEKLLPHTQFKFLYGDIIEELVLFLAKVAGHKVEGEQERLEMEYKGWKIIGHRDAIIDDILVDVKSASSYSFKKFQEGLDNTNDAFGYRMQLQCYNAAGKGKNRPMAWVVADKANGHIAVSPHTKSVQLTKRLDKIVAALDNDTVEPDREFEAVADGKSGNMKLGVECSYCAYKKECWPGLRAFASSRGPVFLTEVKREPMMQEINLEADSETELESALAESTGSR